ncbi:glycoside hydrolase family 6 protein [Kallotenue papyrolyticum]|uniref:glycoside hydrolase family 6 protein n=1 Tax=Kallotenue papyrolyticum TaxID=1325125 RepID=UPI0006943317|nr:glycoside hydrolase family 6 protein [Kallotenue papyrolyticum]
MVAPVLARSAADRRHERETRFYVPRPNHGAIAQIAELTAQGRKQEARLIRAMIETPTAVWLTGGTPRDAEGQARQITRQAAGKKAVPVLVLYNIPFRDCAQYSAGGATNVAEYRAWIDGVVRGIADRRAIVILEPDGLGIIPWYTTINGQLEWCQPAEADPATAAAERFAMLRYAVEQLSALPRTQVYLDGTHDGWLGVGDIADRLIKAGVQQADGFFLNVSNYRWTDRLVRYGSWISQCIELEEQVSWWNPAWCASQYYPADPNDVSTWERTDADYQQRWASVGITPDPAQMAHFVIDTSRNGQGPWTPPAGRYPDPQDWCNPPGRGLGARPTSVTNHALVDALLWIKVPGESDGQCSRGLGSGVVDPEWGRVDPPAGQWFPEQALQLAQLANPPLR